MQERELLKKIKLAEKQVREGKKTVVSAKQSSKEIDALLMRPFRDSYGISPGDEIILEDSKEGIIVKKPFIGVAKKFREIAGQGKKPSTLDSDKDYAQEMKERL